MSSCAPSRRDSDGPKGLFGRGFWEHDNNHDNNNHYNYNHHYHALGFLPPSIQGVFYAPTIPVSLLFL